MLADTGVNRDKERLSSPRLVRCFAIPLKKDVACACVLRRRRGKKKKSSLCCSLSLYPVTGINKADLRRWAEWGEGTTKGGSRNNPSRNHKRVSRAGGRRGPSLGSGSSSSSSAYSKTGAKGGRKSFSLLNIPCCVAFAAQRVCFSTCHDATPPLQICRVGASVFVVHRTFILGKKGRRRRKSAPDQTRETTRFFAMDSSSVLGDREGGLSCGRVEGVDDDGLPRAGGEQGRDEGPGVIFQSAARAPSFGGKTFSGRGKSSSHVIKNWGRGIVQTKAPPPPPFVSVGIIRLGAARYCPLPFSPPQV